MDDADGTFITKSEFLKKWRTQPEMIIEPYNIDTEENVLHFLSRYLIIIVCFVDLDAM